MEEARKLFDKHRPNFEKILGKKPGKKSPEQMVSELEGILTSKPPLLRAVVNRIERGKVAWQPF